LLPVLLDERLLPVRGGLPQEAGHLVVADTEPFQHVVDATGRVADAESRVNPVADLGGCAEAALCDFVLWQLDLVRGGMTGVALVMEGAEGIEPLVAEDAEPFTQLGKADAQQLGDLLTGFARGDRQDGGEALIDAPIQSLLPLPFDLLALLISQDNPLHGV